MEGTATSGASVRYASVESGDVDLDDEDLGLVALCVEVAGLKAKVLRLNGAREMLERVNMLHDCFIRAGVRGMCSFIPH